MATTPWPSAARVLESLGSAVRRQRCAEIRQPQSLPSGGASGGGRVTDGTMTDRVDTVMAELASKRIRGRLPRDWKRDHVSWRRCVAKNVQLLQSSCSNDERTLSIQTMSRRVLPADGENSFHRQKKHQSGQLRCPHSKLPRPHVRPRPAVQIDKGRNYVRRFGSYHLKHEANRATLQFPASTVVSSAAPPLTYGQ